ncbi:metallophosphoesterase family protein [Pediococcus claussenii]|uniref:Calcineurin-like phosphoesterase family protein n=1 Tax=Pediococcus claussenii (strain ATCC BAA-344 / DSM 14800 / JCM 18046 / KCTC 3811 / LMG 21948 / P06) TaxID=701521 RepID=G8PDT4_PEDCP|nr:DNA repair exonuclease [Pediococcus claussenii]AEV95419.1 calcineurin-like phosphoesterase family protein [Pediococcus claussenii ATCC BAA-344]ANZ68949.1 hypothetical protein AYR57_00805 [Pediococcus claussenii]ANZ70765.1 hypothetical protein AYR58_00805 [Pediococcus claussenii]KRN19062.1 hypothetical protein IV79_GL001724 [Pediococcus claussenii]
MKFIHAADIHLGSPFKGLKDIDLKVKQRVLDATGEAFKQLISNAIRDQVDFVLIVGDLFDNANPDLNSINLAIDQFEKLQDAGILVFLSFGNHDFLNNRIPVNIFPKNVNVFNADISNKIIELSTGERIGIAGFSYDKQAVTADMASLFPIRDSKVDFQIGMLHGSMDGINAPESHYAPFTKQELLNKNYDYWALGHIHQRQILNEMPIIQYSGNIQGRHVNENGKRGYYLLETNSSGIDSKFVETSRIIWKRLAYGITNEKDTREIIEHMITKVESSKEDVFQIIDLSLENADQLTRETVEQLSNGLVRDRVQAALGIDDFWIHKIKINFKTQTLQFSELDQSFWSEAQKAVFKPAEINSVAGKLFQNQFIAEEYLSDEQINELYNDVKVKLIEENVFGENTNED